LFIKVEHIQLYSGNTKINNKIPIVPAGIEASLVLQLCSYTFPSPKSPSFALRSASNILLQLFSIKHFVAALHSPVNDLPLTPFMKVGYNSCNSDNDILPLPLRKNNGRIEVDVR